MSAKIENLPLAELRKRRAELIVAAAGLPELAARYIQARIDASARDVRLGEMGREITALQTERAELIERVAQLQRDIESLKSAPPVPPVVPVVAVVPRKPKSWIGRLLSRKE